MKYAELFSYCDAFIIQNEANLFYFSGYENADAIIAASPGGAFYITDNRYTEEAKASIKNMEIVQSSPDSFFKSAKDLLGGAKKVGYEKSNISYLQYLNLQSLNCELIDISAKIGSLRMIKSEEEAERVRRAQSITDEVFEKVLEYIRPGIGERKLAGKLESLLFECGADSLAFPSIVAAGKNTSKPHAHRTDYILRKGDLVTLDFGAKLNGYCSDMTRTVSLGDPGERAKAVYKTVLHAQTQAIADIKAGMSGKEADAIARDIFAAQGYKDYFTHSLGHGLGIEVHEDPRLSYLNENPLKQNMIFSVEPGLYFENEFGIRIEDLVILGKDGIINLTKSAKNLIIL
ncbi:MAG: M24 family metallopeptidase [Christensenellales bacterium]|jgi:Xaa-Pro aminopeptidase